MTDAGDYLAIPTTLQASLLARLDRLAPVREVAQIGAALGRQFSHELISAVSRMPQLGSIGPVTPAVVPALISALSDDNKQIHWNVADGLGRIGPAAAAPALIAAMDNADESVRQRVARALEQIGLVGAGQRRRRSRRRPRDAK